MESKRLAMLVTMMVVGNLLIQTEAQAPPPQPSHNFRSCYPSCIVTCAIEKQFKFPETLMCPLTCIKTCLLPPVPVPSPSSQIVSTNEINHIDYYCKLGCATRHCASLSSVENPNADEVADCVDSCSDKCATKN